MNKKFAKTFVIGIVFLFLGASVTINFYLLNLSDKNIFNIKKRDRFLD